MSWLAVYDQVLQVTPQGDTLPPIPLVSIPNLTGKDLLIYAVSAAAEDDWWLALDLSVNLSMSDSPVAGILTSRIAAARIQLGVLTTIQVPPIAEIYSLEFKVPRWLGQIHVRVWQNSEALLLARRAGYIAAYSGSQSESFGYLDDVDGKWVYLTLSTFRTIGSASSGADIKASWLQILFSHIWNQYSNTRCPMLSAGGSTVSRGTNSASDWENNRRLTLPDFRGRVLVGAGTGSGLTARTKAAIVGAETHALSVSEMPPHSHTVSDGRLDMVRMSVAGVLTNQSAYSNTPNLIGSTGGGAAHNNMQPSAIEHLLISAGTR